MHAHSQRSRRQAHQSRYSVQQKKHRRTLLLESLEPRTVLSSGLLGAVTDGSPWQNPLGPSDLNADGTVTPVDVLLAINELNRGVSGQLAGRLAPPVLAGQVQGAISNFFDANGDGQLTPGDVLQVVNSLNVGPDGGPTSVWPTTDQQPDQIGDTVPELVLTRGFARVYAELNTAGDVDVFRVIPTQDRLNVTLFGFSHVELNLSIVDANGNELDTQTAFGSRLAPASASDLAVTSGETYYLVVSGASDVTGRYSLQVMNYGGEDYVPIAPAQIGVTLPATVPSGQPVTVQLVALNAQKRPVDSYSGTVTLSSSDLAATLPTSVTFKHGRASVEVTFATAGSQTLTVTDRTDATLTGQATTEVGAPAVATQLAVRLPQTVSAGTPVTVQLVAVDAQQHLVPTYTGTVNVSSSDGQATVPVSVTFEQGRASFEVTFATEGSQTLTATDSADATLIGQATTNVVAPAVATQLVVRLPPSVPAGVAVPVQAVALDANDHLVSDYSGTVTVTSSDANATLPASVTFKNGYASFQVNFGSAGSQTLTVTDSADMTLTAQATTSVVAPDVATQLVVRLPQNVPTGVAVTVQLAAVDAKEHLVSRYAGTVSVTSSDPNATLPASITFKNGSASFQVTFATAGSQTLSVTDSANASLTGQATTNVVAPAAATQLAVRLPQTVPTATAVTVQLAAVDARGRLVSNYLGTVSVASSDASATLPSSVTFKNGYASFQVTFATAGEQTLTVTDSADPTITGQGKTTVGTTPPTTGAFNIDLKLTGMTASEQQIARQAAARWEAVIVGDLPAVNYHGTTIDDVVINVGLQRMDGAGGILGEGGPDAVRTGDGLPYLGTIMIDTADVALLERQGELLDVLTHEIGHVLGLGTVWDSKGLVAGTTSNPLFIGPQATAAYNAVFGTNATGVPLENRGRAGDGTYDAHWRQSVFHDELMVGYIQSGGMPLSSITVASMADIGYQVNMAAAESYQPTGVTLSSVASSTSAASSGATSLASATTSLPTDSAGDPAPVATGRKHHRHAPAGGAGSTSAGSTSTNQIAVGTRRHARSAIVDLAFRDTGWWFDA